MSKKISFVIWIFLFSLANENIFSQETDEDIVRIEKDMVKVNVDKENPPLFSWDVDIKVGRIIVEKDSREYWGSETEGDNNYQSPVRYGVHPKGAVEPEAAWPLKAGETYTVKLYRWINVKPEKFQLLGLQEFTPSAGSATEEDESSKKGFKRFEELDPKNFDNPTKIDNEWMPLIPGTKFVFVGHTVEDGETTPHRVEFIVTDLTKVINGVRTVVIYDSDFTDGVLEEAELTFFAQDNDGNVWHLGQYRETFDEVEFVGGRVWLIGHLDGAKAGIMMKAKPKVGTPSYSQGYAPPPFNWTDRGRTYKMGEKTVVKAGSFDDVLITEEFNEEEPNAFQLKYYARGVGNVRIGWRGDDKQQETMELIEYTKLNAKELAEYREKAFELEKRAYIYSTTPAAEQIKMAN